MFDAILRLSFEIFVAAPSQFFKVFGQVAASERDVNHVHPLVVLDNLSFFQKRSEDNYAKFLSERTERIIEDLLPARIVFENVAEQDPLCVT